MRSGSHGITGASTNDGGIVLDMAHLDDVRLADESAGPVRVGAGTVCGDVAVVLSPHDLALTAATSATPVLGD